MNANVHAIYQYINVWKLNQNLKKIFFPTGFKIKYTVCIFLIQV